MGNIIELTYGIMGASRNVKQVQRVFQGSVKDVLRKIEGWDSRKFHKKFHGCFKNLSMKFRFAILL